MDTIANVNFEVTFFDGHPSGDHFKFYKLTIKGHPVNGEIATIVENEKGECMQLSPKDVFKLLDSRFVQNVNKGALMVHSEMPT